MTAATADPDELRAASVELDGAEPERILDWAFDRFSRVALVASFQAESSVLIDLAAQHHADVEIVTLDTGRLPQETLDLIDLIQRSYPVRVQVVTPDPAQVAEMTAARGVNLFYRSQENRQLCCDVRKSRPLGRALAGFDAWITGLRRGQSSTRSRTPVVSVDHAHGGIAKIAPLVNWSHQQVWDRIRAGGLPYHALYTRNYTSIGCAPCTRATEPGEDERAGRWWWEGDSVKECGLHWQTADTGASGQPVTAQGGTT